VTSLHRDYLPSSWGMYSPTKYDWMTYIGTIGFFLLCILLFIRRAAGDLDLRDARAGARDGRGGGAPRVGGLIFYTHEA